MGNFTVHLRDTFKALDMVKTMWNCDDDDDDDDDDENLNIMQISQDGCLPWTHQPCCPYWHQSIKFHPTPSER